MPLKKRRSVVIPSDLERVIEESKSILDLPDDWDEEGSPAVTEETWNRAVGLLRTQTDLVLARFGLALPVPRILPGPDGSVDLHWKTGKRELLLNVPADPSEAVSYYGDDFGSDRRRGTINPGALDADLFLWLAVTD
ncbi:MAG TPA: hypothetical protein VGG03_20850 [Thermoanaerobaculia bacterium]|jgi:hypothetical protein